MKVDQFSNRLHLPVDDVRDQIAELLIENNISIILGETGSGKSTQIPQICLQHNINKDLRIAVTQPRRVAAISLARRVAEEQSVELGSSVGYRVRFENVTSSDTKIVFMTDGMLLREAIHDGFLKEFSMIIVDEAHERTLHTDVLLNILRLSQRDRMDTDSPLKVVIMSATMQTELFSSYFGGAPSYLIKGRTFPVELFYANAVGMDSSDYVYNTIVTIVQLHKLEPLSDDILVFLTGREEIEMVIKKLKEVNEKLESKMKLVPLYAALPSACQQKVFDPAPSCMRKVIVATNIAETSLTIPGIRIVVDSGRVKMKTYSPETGIHALRVRPISRAQAAQRAGRAGREASGKCYRLYSERDFEKFEHHTVAEILRTNLASVILELYAIGMTNIMKLKLIEQPEKDMLVDAQRQLVSLDALTLKKKGKKGKLTKTGQIMAKFPVEPEFSKVLLAASELGCLEEASTIVATMVSEDIFLSSQDDSEEIERARARFKTNEGDHLAYLNAIRMFSSEKKKNNSVSFRSWASNNGLNLRALTNAVKVKKQLKEVAKDQNLKLESCGSDKDKLRKALAIGLFMNACTYDREKDCYRLMVNPSVLVHIHPSSCLNRTRPAAFVFSQLLRTNKLYAKQLTLIDVSWIQTTIETYRKNRW